MKTGEGGGSRSRAAAAPLTAVDRVVSASCYLHVQGSATLNASLRCTKKRVGLNDEQHVVEYARHGARVFWLWRTRAYTRTQERIHTHAVFSRRSSFFLESLRTQFPITVVAFRARHCRRHRYPRHCHWRRLQCGTDPAARRITTRPLSPTNP